MGMILPERRQTANELIQVGTFRHDKVLRRLTSQPALRMHPEKVIEIIGSRTHLNAKN
jgi:hypothetical protein